MAFNRESELAVNEKLGKLIWQSSNRTLVNIGKRSITWGGERGKLYFSLYFLQEIENLFFIIMLKWPFWINSRFRMWLHDWTHDIGPRRLNSNKNHLDSI